MSVLVVKCNNAKYKFFSPMDKAIDAQENLPKVVLYPDARLRQVSANVPSVDSAIRADFDLLAKCLVKLQGLGLAGVQIGIMKKLFVVDQAYVFQRSNNPAIKPTGKLLYFANAEIIEKSNEMIQLPDGCISIPSVFSKTSRHANITVKYLDYDNKEQILEADGLLGFCIQHEIDHTNGKLFFDLLSTFKRKLLLDQYAKYLKRLG